MMSKATKMFLFKHVFLLEVFIHTLKYRYFFDSSVLYLFANLDKCTQTVAALSANSPRKQKLKEETKTLKRAATPSTSSSKKRKCQMQLERQITIEDVHKYLEKNYSEESCKSLKTQLNLLNKSPKGCRYTDEFKKFALSVYFLGPKAYKQFSTLYRLPSKSTLNRFTRKWTINSGFNEFIFRLLELRAKMFKEKEKDCTICLDEITLKSHLFYDISRDKIVGFQESHNPNSTAVATTALVVMVRGIASNWKQPIAYFFYNSAAPSEEIKEILFESVRKLTAIGFNVRGVVSDQGSNFRKLVNKVLKVTPQNIFFFVDNVRLVYFFDVPHLLKSTRNNFFTYNFRLPEGTVKKCYLDTFYEHDKKKEYRLCPKLTNEHLSPGNFQKMKVKYASQIFSHSVAAALQTYIDFKVLPSDANVTVKFIKTINDLFDLLNSCHLNNFNAFMGTEKQFKFLEEIESMFDNLKVLKMVKVKDQEKSVEKCLNNQMHFIYGWKLTINSTKALWETLKSRRYTFLLTRNLNQDCIENFFGQIRNCCGNARNPTPIQFSRAFKKLFTLKYFNQVDGANCIDDINEVLLNITPELLENCKTIIPEPTAKNPLKVFTSDYRNISSTDGNALVYVTGYLLKKSLLQHSCDVCLNYNEQHTLKNEATVFFKSKAYSGFKQFGGLNTPPLDIVEFIINLENIFVENFNNIACQNRVGKKLKDLFKNITFTHPCKNFPCEYFVSLYIRVRIYFTIKFANRDIKDQIREKKIKPNLKLKILQNL